MPELDPQISQYSHRKDFPREKEALHTLKKIASLVKPIMRARSWKVGILTEFYPEQQNLLGLNVNKGQKICLRLRHAGDKNQFLPMEQVVDTMLHELSHNVHGPHDEKFHALWDQLRKEHEALLSKGYTGEGFMSDGHRLGGAKVSRDEARRIARKAAEKRQNLSAGSGQKLGGSPVRAGTDIRKVILDAIERRSTVLKGCASDNKGLNEREVINLADEAEERGFATQAEEDEANERAIAEALWDLIQEDEKKEFGSSYIPPSQQHPTGNGRTSQKPPSGGPSAASSSRAPPRHVSRLVSEAAPKPSKSSKPVPKRPVEPPKQTSTPVPKSDPLPTGWTCDICTLHNPINFLSCDACTTERPERITQQLAEADQKRKAAVTQPAGSKSTTWTCRRCTTVMENQWWTCMTCGELKASS